MTATDDRGVTDTLIPALVTASFQASPGVSRRLQASQGTTDRFVAVMREQIAAAARRHAVEHVVAELLASDYAPTAAAIQRAVFCPDQKLIDHYRQEPAS
jgi:hypothetical protein